MSIKSVIQPWAAKFIASDFLLNFRRGRTERRRNNDPIVIDVFVRVDDPYSYLLLQVLPDLVARFGIQFSFHVVSSLQASMYPEPELWVQNAQRDAGLLAGLYKLDFPSTAHVIAADESQKVTQALLGLENKSGFLEQATSLLAKYWSGETIDSCGIGTDLDTQANDQLLESMGHYLSATLHYGGEWYWGLDRLDHLERRLNSLGVNKSEATVEYDLTSRDFCSSYRAKVSAHKNTPLEIYFSARSPYSYLGLERAHQLAAHYDIPLIVKPILPMMMRGMNVPPNKKWYIFSDTKREAKKLGIDYGFVADPLGAAVERCYALLAYARSQGKELEYLLSFARGVNAQGIRAETDRGLRKIVERAGLDWQQCKPLLSNSDWRLEVENNYAELSQLGLWGVPCLRFDDVVVWGQDRLEFIERKICGETLGSLTLK